MNLQRSAVLLAAVVLLGLTVASVAGGAFASTFGASNVADVTELNDPDEEPSEQESGQDDSEAESESESAPEPADDTEQGVNTFMHSSTADTSNAIESEMFEAEYEAASNDTQETLVDERADGLTATLESLEDEREELRENRDELSDPQYQARMTQLTVEITALERSVEQTKPFAADTEVGVDRLDSIQESITDLGGEQIAEVAKGIVGFDEHLDDTQVDEVDEESDAADDAADGEGTDDDALDGNESVGDLDDADGNESAALDGNETPSDESEYNESTTE
jgi:hypothetical protein